MSKKRILWMGEASFLNTGYGVYAHEVLTRLHNTGKYEIAELGGYATATDPRRATIPWKYYGCIPHEEREYSVYESQNANQWGAWRFEEICIDFKPDVVIDIRDWWMIEFQSRSPFRRHFTWAIMPTIDSAPQMEAWLATYLDGDYVCAYSEYGRDVMHTESNGTINFVDLASPAADYNIFKPVADRKEHKQAMGFESDCKIVGTIMRNQKRKLYPNLIAAFKKFLEMHPETGKETYLYIHTHFPDIGWDIPRLIKESGIGHKILCTYVCSSCKHAFPSFFHDAVQTCTMCGRPTAKMPTGSNGVTTQQLANIINCFDVYVQYSICEGFGMPQVEAAACGVPVMAVNYSAMESVLKNINGIPLDVLYLQREAETHCFRAIPDDNSLCRELGRFLSKPESIRAIAGRNTYLSCRRNYQWSKAASVWEKIVDEAPKSSTWDSPPRIINPAQDIPVNTSTENFVRWCIENVWGEPDKTSSYIALRMMRDLTYGEAIDGYGGPYYCEDSLLVQRPKFKTFGKREALEMLLELGKLRNYWEQRRIGIIQEDQSEYIKMANMKEQQ